MARQRQHTTEEAAAMDAPQEQSQEAPAEAAAQPPQLAAARKRPRKEIPPEYRPYYVLFGQPRDGRPLQRIGRYKTKRRAEAFVSEAEELLKNTYEAVEIVFCRRKGWMDLR